jgi:hypothetical protein
MAGQQKSVYLEPQDIKAVEAYAKRKMRSFSWALRELLRRGWHDEQLSTEEDFQQLKGRGWRNS